MANPSSRPKMQAQDEQSLTALAPHLEKCGCPEDKVRRACEAGAPFSDIMTVLIQQALPIFLKYLEDWINGRKPACPPPPAGSPGTVG